MKTNWTAYLLAGALLAGISGTAAANGHVSFGISVGVPAPVYVAPPAPVVYAPPAPVYYGPPAPVVYTAPPAYYGPGFYDRWGRWHPRPHHRRYW